VGLLPPPQLNIPPAPLTGNQPVSGDAGLGPVIDTSKKEQEKQAKEKKIKKKEAHTERRRRGRRN